MDLKCLEGDLCETKYEWPPCSDQTDEKEMVIKCKTPLKRNAVAYINGK